MPRKRDLKPSFFKNEDLADLHPLTRLMFAALWTLSDRNGRLEDRPRRIKTDTLPYDDHDIEAALDDLEGAGFIARYEVDDLKLIEITHFSDHQKPHPNEPAVYPANPHGCREQLQNISNREMQSPRARESVLGVSGKGIDLSVVISELESLWPDERCRPTASELRQRALFDAHRAGELPGDVTDQAQLYVEAHAFATGAVSGCPNLHRWIEERRWNDPLPHRKPTSDDYVTRKLKGAGLA